MKNYVRDATVPPFRDGNKIVIRGTEEWEQREAARQRAGCRCLSFGKIPFDGGMLIDTSKRY
jgi:hypothetical protein